MRRQTLLRSDSPESSRMLEVEPKPGFAFATFACGHVLSIVPPYISSSHFPVQRTATKDVVDVVVQVLL